MIQRLQYTLLTVLLLITTHTACSREERSSVSHDTVQAAEVVEPAFENHETVEEHAARTVIVMVESDTTQEEISQLCDDFNLTITYSYEMLSGYALSADHALTKREMEDLLAELQEYSFVLGAEADSVITLDATGD